jgi:gas vesicle protein
MPSSKTPQEQAQDIKDARSEAVRAKKSINTLEKTARRKYSSIETIAKDVKTKATDQLKSVTADFSLKKRDFTKIVNQDLKDIEKLTSDTKRDAAKFDKLYTSVTSPKLGVKARHDQIDSLHSEAVKTNQAIIKEHDKVRSNAGKVSELLASSRNDRRNISTINENAKKVNKAIQETYKLTLDTTMSGSLIERRDDLKVSTRWWSIGFFTSIISIVAGILLVAFSIILAGDKVDFVRLIVERLLFVTPLIVVALVLSRYYNHERKLYEEYAFKAASAQTIRGYTVLLNQEFGDSDDPKVKERVLEFTISVMTGIFDREPLVQTPTLLHFVFGGNLARFEAKIEDKLENKIDDLVQKAKDVE